MPRARIVAVSDGPVHVIQLILDPAQQAFEFAPGQYTALIAADGSAVPFSIASAPHRLPELEIHFQPVESAPEASRIRRLLKSAEVVELAPPAGSVHLTDGDQALSFVCGGSGIAQAWSMLEHLAAHPRPAESRLLWCVDDESQLYLRERLEKLEFLSAEFIIDTRRDEANRGLTWLRQNASSLHDSQVFLCGGPGFVWSAVDALQAVRADGWQLASDVFDYAPRC